MLSRPNSSLAFVKIGCCKGLPAQRIRQRAKLYPEAALYHAEPFSFSQRIGRLTHLEMADKRRSKRCDIDSCKSKNLDEWFERYPVEVKQAIRQWKRLPHFCLYDTMTRQLENRCKLLLQKSIPIVRRK